MPFTPSSLLAVNTYITPVLRQGKWSLPRQPGAMPLPTSSYSAGQTAAAVSGVSSFAFQGTNAHALLEAPPAPSGISRPAAQLWQRVSYWLLAPQFDLIQAVQAGSRLALFAVSLQAPAAASLLQVVAGGASHITAGAAIELAAEAASHLAAGSGGVADGSSRLLSDLVMSTAAVPAGQQASASSLQLAVAPATCAFELRLLANQQIASAGAACSSGSLHTVAAVRQQSEPTSSMPAAISLLPGSLEGLSAPACSTADVAEDAHSLLQTVAIGPAALEASMQLLSSGPLVTAVGRVLLASMAADSESRHVAAGTTRVRFATADGVAGPHLHGIASTSSPAVLGWRKHAAAAADQPADMLYSIGWEAASPASMARPASASCAVSACRSAGAAEAVAVAQAALQQVPAGSISVDLHGALQQTAALTVTTSMAAAAALHGVLKALAQEAPAVSVAVYSSCGDSGSIKLDSTHRSWTVSTSRSAPAEGSSNLHGVASSRGASYLPRLMPEMPAAPHAGSSRKVTSEARGQFVVTGGSGALARYAALWLLQQGGASVLLASRAGTVPAAVLGGIVAGADSCVQSSKADASQGGDVEMLLGRTAGDSVRGIVHAGGVLADATLTNQTLAGIRQAS